MDIKPAQTVEQKEKEALAKRNAEETAEAHRLAAEHRARDERNAPPLVSSIASSIKEKLENLPPKKEEGQAQQD